MLYDIAICTSTLQARFCVDRDFMSLSVAVLFLSLYRSLPASSICMAAVPRRSELHLIIESVLVLSIVGAVLVWPVSAICTWTLRLRCRVVPDCISSSLAVSVSEHSR